METKGLHYLGGVKIMDGKWFRPPLFEPGHNAEEMVWASIIWAGGAGGGGDYYYLRVENNGSEMVRASIIWAGRKIMETKWFGPPLFGRGGK